MVRACQPLPPTLPSSSLPRTRKGQALHTPDRVCRPRPDAVLPRFPSPPGLGNTNASRLRRELAEWVEAHPETLIAETPLRDWVKWDTGSSVRDYARRMAVGGWGGGIEMAACARLKRVNVHGAGSFALLLIFSEADGALPLLWRLRMRPNPALLAQPLEIDMPLICAWVPYIRFTVHCSVRAHSGADGVQAHQLLRRARRRQQRPDSARPVPCAPLSPPLPAQPPISARVARRSFSALEAKGSQDDILTVSCPSRLGRPCARRGWGSFRRARSGVFVAKPTVDTQAESTGRGPSPLSPPFISFLFLSNSVPCAFVSLVSFFRIFC